jgi:glyoxylase-like metal-dependent hydrolase (beta-lactamase superfamily II)
MPKFICGTCGIQYGESQQPVAVCRICADERQYVGDGAGGPQRWTTLERLREDGYRNEIRQLEPGLVGIRTEPQFGIGQRALLVCTPGGNVLFDCISLIDQATVDSLSAVGGVQAITVSHPHFYSSIIEWSRAFGGAPVCLPEADREWVTRPDAAIRYWSGKIEPVPGLTLIQCGGHFEGSAALHWPGGAGGKGALLAGDTISVVQDHRFVTFMRSYPNQIPLPEAAVRGILEAVEPYEFDRLYGVRWDSVVKSDAKAAVRRSAERYIRWIRGR